MTFKKAFLVFYTFIAVGASAQAQHSVARQWNDVMLQAIREDYARPPIHARNLFHVSVAMYDMWAAYDSVATTYFLGKNVHGYTCHFNGIETPSNIVEAQEEAISYAAYRLLTYRFKDSPGDSTSLARFDSLMVTLGYDPSVITLDYLASPAGLGNYIAQFLINYGLQDGSNETGDFKNKFYKPINIPLVPDLPGNPTLTHPNRWQPLTLDVFIDQSGHVISGVTPEFQSPEWGSVKPFALKSEDLEIKVRDSNDYWIYHLPQPPPSLDTNQVTGSEEYKWTFELVSKWSSHLDPADTIIWDISPASIGNVQTYPVNFTEMKAFYKETGGDPGTGYSVNPTTNLPYQPQLVKRADYGRVLAEFWADGPNSETPPGHWFTILNYVSDHPLSVKKFKGEGRLLSDLEWDVKCYFALAGAMHDAAITAWGIKGYYDYIRPISALRYMADLGQSSDSTLPSYHPGGITLKNGLIELVGIGDSLAGPLNQNVGKIKVFAWKGPEFIVDPNTDIAGVGWILAENWWPYQRPTFITPPFAGYVSGHSTFSRAAAEVLTYFTGDAFFPGGMATFFAKKNEFLVFEEGPSMNVTLQWATYRDASDQCSLSRIWGGIHPPADDIPGRLIGIQVGTDAVKFAETYFLGNFTGLDEKRAPVSTILVYPNPVENGVLTIDIGRAGSDVIVQCYDDQGRLVLTNRNSMKERQGEIVLNTKTLNSGIYLLRVSGDDWSETEKVIIP